MSNIIESHFGTLMSPKKIAAGAASSVRKQGAFTYLVFALILMIYVNIVLRIGREQRVLEKF